MSDKVDDLTQLLRPMILKLMEQAYWEGYNDALEEEDRRKSEEER